MIDKPRFKLPVLNGGSDREEQFAQLFFYLAIGVVWTMIGIIVVAYFLGYRSVPT